MTVREFIGGDYVPVTMSAEGKFVRTYGYGGAMMEVRT